LLASYWWIRPPSHQTKTMKTALRPENFDERSAVVVKKEKCAVFKFILRLYYVPGRFSLRLTRLCQVLTTSNTFPLIYYRVHYHARTTSNAFLLRSWPIRSHHVLNTRLPRSHCVHSVLINTAPRAGLDSCHQMLLPYSDSKFQACFQCFPVVGVHLVTSRTNSLQQFVKYLRWHPQEIEERLLIVHS